MHVIQITLLTKAYKRALVYDPIIEAHCGTKIPWNFNYLTFSREIFKIVISAGFRNVIGSQNIKEILKYSNIIISLITIVNEKIIFHQEGDRSCYNTSVLFSIL